MFAAYQRYGFSEAAAMHVDQHVSMLLLDLGHVVKNLRRLRILRAQVIGIGAVDARVIFFRRDGERQDFLFAEGGKGTFGKREKTVEHG